MFNAFAKNDQLLLMLDVLTDEDADLEPVRKAFEAAKGDFRSRFTAAVQARLAQMAVPEIFIDLPENPEELRKSDLEELVRPAPAGFLRSHPTKDELVYQVARIRRRQEERPAWISRTDRHGVPLPSSSPDLADDVAMHDRPVVVSALTELGEITVHIPTWDPDAPDISMEAGGVGEWEAALFSVLRLTRNGTPTPTIAISAEANEALVPEEARWWAIEPPQPVPATQDPGVASELLATSATLGGLPVTDNTSEGYDAIVDALLAADDWRYSPEWVLETWEPGDSTRILTVARAAIAGWADEDRSGIVLYVHGATLSDVEGLFGTPSPLHSYVLTVTRSADATDSISTVHRAILSCPSENWCHRGGCPRPDFPDLAMLRSPVAAAARAADQANGGANAGWAETFAQSYGDGDSAENAERVLELAGGLLSGAGWTELDESSWDTGREELLLRRGEHCLTVMYDPATRQFELADGKAALETMLQLLADDGLLIGDDEAEHVSANPTAVEQWGTEFLAAADSLLQGQIKNLPQLVSPRQITILGLHPHGDGCLRGPQATSIAEHQLGAMFRTLGLLE